MTEQNAISKAAGGHRARGAIDDYLARRMMRSSEGFRPAPTRDEDGIITLTMRTDPETLPGWKEAGEEFVDAESWAAEGGEGYIYNFGEPVSADMVEMAWRVGPEDGVVAVAYGTLLLVREPMLVDDVLEDMRALDVDGAAVMEGLYEDFLEGQVFILRGVEVVEERRGQDVWRTLTGRMVADVMAETGGRVPLVIVDVDRITDADAVGHHQEDPEGVADVDAAIGSFVALHPPFDGAVAVSVMGCCDLDGAAWPDARGVGADHGATPPIVPSAGNAKLAMGHSSHQCGIVRVTVDGAIATAEAWRTRPAMDAVDLRRALVSLVPVVALEQRKDWRRDVDRLLDAVAALDGRITAADRLEGRTAQPFALANPKGDLGGAVFNRAMLATNPDWGSRAGRQHDAMIMEAAHEGIAALMRQREHTDATTEDGADPAIHIALLIRTALELAGEA